jgi:hypothetical protein
LKTSARRCALSPCPLTTPDMTRALASSPSSHRARPCSSTSVRGNANTSRRVTITRPASRGVAPLLHRHTSHITSLIFSLIRVAGACWQAMLVGMCIVLWWQLRRRNQTSKGGLGTLLSLAADRAKGVRLLPIPYPANVLALLIGIGGLFCQKAGACSYLRLRAADSRRRAQVSMRARGGAHSPRCL